jgi:soluble lytic murein transglycosylase
MERKIVTKIFNKKILIVLILVILILLSLFKIFKVQDILAKKIYPNKYEKYVENYSKQYNVEKNLVFAIIKAESNFNENAISNRGATGLMQLMPATANEVAQSINIDCNEENLSDPNININLGIKYISTLIEKYGNKEVALAAYNAGTGNIDSWIEKGIIKKDGTDIENIPYKETNNYVRKILRDYIIYQKLYQS